MRTAPPAPELAIPQREPSGKIAGNPQLVAGALHVYSHTTALCTDVGVPPLRLTQVQLAQLYKKIHTKTSE